MSGVGLPHSTQEVYNLERLHSVLGYLALNGFEELLLIQQNTGLLHQTILTLPVQS